MYSECNTLLFFSTLHRQTSTYFWISQFFKFFFTSHCNTWQPTYYLLKKTLANLWSQFSIRVRLFPTSKSFFQRNLATENWYILRFPASRNYVLIVFNWRTKYMRKLCIIQTRIAYRYGIGHHVARIIIIVNEHKCILNNI